MAWMLESVSCIVRPRLETEILEGIRVPTLGEMLRVKAWMVVTRNAVRDFLDVCALADRLGEGLEAALEPMERCYPQPPECDPTLLQVAKQLAEPRPYDFDPSRDSLYAWRHLKAPWTDWAYMQKYARGISWRIFCLLVKDLGPSGPGEERPPAGDRLDDGSDLW